MLQFRNVFEVNTISVFDLLQHAIPWLRKSNGRVIIVSSGASSHAYQGWGAYSASKAALNSLCRTLAVEEPSLTAIAVRPGVVK